MRMVTVMGIMRRPAVSGLLRKALLPSVSGHGRHRSHRSLSTNSNPKDTTARPKRLLALAIETSCDDTCVAVIEKYGGSARILLNTKITSDNRKFGGVEPITTIESHTTEIGPLVESALRSLPEADPGADRTEVLSFREPHPVTRRQPDIICVTRGPGMMANLGIGLAMAKGLSVAWQVPLVAVHHMQAHALTPRLVSAINQPWPSEATEGGTTKESTLLPQAAAPARNALDTPLQPAFPFLSLLVSGGHTQLLLSRSITSHSILAESHNAAIGDMLDKCARAILPPSLLDQAQDIMYGAQLEAFAFPGTQDQTTTTPYDYGYWYTPPARRADEIRPYVSPTHGWSLTPPLSERRDMTFDFSGLSGQVRALTQKNPAMGYPERRELARQAMRLAFEHLASRVLFALDSISSSTAKEEGATTPTTLVVAGGVASNRFLRHVLRAVLDARGHKGLAVSCPPAALCTDNAAMIGWAGAEMYEAGWRSSLRVRPIRKWSMDGEEGGDGGGGIMGVDGWLPVGGEDR